MSLQGKRVVVTRARHQADQLVELLEQAGAVPVVMPVIDIVDPDDGGEAMQEALTRLKAFDWVVVTSVNTVPRLAGVALPEGVQVAAIGSETAQRLHDLGWRVDLVPPQFVAESLVEAFPEGPGSVLLPRAAVARDVLPDGLRAKGWQMTVVDAYKTVELQPDATVIDAAIEADFVTFAAPSAVRAFAKVLGGLTPQGGIACIGPVTEAAVLKQGWEVTVTADVHTIEGLVSKLNEVSG